MRDFHATPEVCPPPADIAAAFPASAERRSDDADYLAAFAAKLADHNRDAEDDTEEEIAAAWRRDGYLAAALVVTPPGAVAKLAFAASMATDYGQIERSDEPLPQAWTSLRASLPGLPKSVADALAFATDAIESNARNHNKIFRELRLSKINVK